MNPCLKTWSCGVFTRINNNTVLYIKGQSWDQYSAYVPQRKCCIDCAYLISLALMHQHLHLTVEYGDFT